MDDLYADTLRETLQYFSEEELKNTVIPQALTYSSGQENLTTRRIAAHILGQVSSLISDKVFYKQKVLGRMLQFYVDFKYDLRKIVVIHSESLLKLVMDLIKHAPSSLNLKDLKENKLYILSEMCELIDDASDRSGP